MPFMTDCKHDVLVLLPQKSGRLRCLHCHLTIKADELGDGYCPECFDTQGKRHFDFEEIKSSGKETTVYRCDECGIMIECD